MSVRIRLRKVGRKKQPAFRVVVTDRAAPRDGAYIEAIGFYNPRRQPAQLRLDLDRTDYWLSRGAEPSETVHSLILKARKGGDAKVALVKPESEAPQEARSRAPRQRRAAEPTAETEAKAAPEVGNEAIDGADSPVDKKKAPRAGSRGRGRAPTEAEEAGQPGATGRGKLAVSGEAGATAKPTEGTAAADELREAEQAGAAEEE